MLLLSAILQVTCSRCLHPIVFAKGLLVFLCVCSTDNYQILLTSNPLLHLCCSEKKDDAAVAEIELVLSKITLYRSVSANIFLNLILTIAENLKTNKFLDPIVPYS